MLFYEEAGFRIYCFVLLCLYLITGFYGVLWVSDEFDYERSLFYGFFAVPFSLLFYAQTWYRPRWWQTHPVSFWTTIIILLLSFSWGNFLWLNGISGSEKAVVNVTINDAAYEITHRRGGLDWLYKPRW
ncbi:hypothetical protein [Pseudobacteriovorax antillogorgiicola]|uniref:Uncharacterized protein n=1 Tax=Pseudobacteriovorax antillogorgiicola TaxID=1513793 RepID=A0A1Y6C442_9BACT|nr:hypothetical protein [Pseudobacteriovorax antillogorgiicola]TCS50723.1 hypothetical protein EDD56_112106 [Pseudobacteriovorax antillogorgiicola]SMF40807.1 hypothetical protein SAMN06296036_112105 [Pseudobacteriovorax antillogorgiicola]